MQFSYIIYVIKIYSIKVFLAMRLLFSEVDILILLKSTDNGQQTTEEATPVNRQQTTDNSQR